MTVRIDILEQPDSAYAELTAHLVRQVAFDLDVGIALHRTVLTTAAQALAARSAGTPTVLVAGHDLELAVQPIATLSRRRYQGDESLPPRWLVEAALLRALQPQSILFLCYANSVRSQLAEALARKWLPPTVQVQSAGTISCYVHALARQVLDEIEIDTTALRSKSVDEIESAPVEAVITLCDEQSCPVYLGHTRRVHWPIQDPSSVVDVMDALHAFRACRDEIEQRVRLLVPR